MCMFPQGVHVHDTSTLLFPVENEVRSLLQSFPNWKDTGTDGIWQATEEEPVKDLTKLCYDKKNWKRSIWNSQK